MTMMERPKFRRKRKSVLDDDQRAGIEDDVRPVEPLEPRKNRLARQQAEADAAARKLAAEQQQRKLEKQRLEELERAAAEEEARIRAESEALRIAEEKRARAKAEALARRKAAEQKAKAEAEAREREQAAKAAALAAAREKAEHEARRKVEAARLEAKAREEELAALRREQEDAANREARRLEAEALRLAEEEARRAEEQAIREAAEREQNEKRLQEAKARKERERQEVEKARKARQAEARARAKAEEKRKADEAEKLRLQAEEEQRQRDAEKAAIRMANEVKIAAKREAEEKAEAAARAAILAAPLELTDPVVPKPVRPKRPVAKPAPRPAAVVREESPAPVAKAPPMQLGADAAWAALPQFAVDEDHLTRNRIVTASRDDPAHTAFDVLRTRLLQALSEHGWKRVAITSPTKDCGKTFTAANLAISLSRQENCRTLLIDCDMRRPSLHKVMGVKAPAPVGDMLRGRISPQDHLMRLGENNFHAGHNIAFGFNNVIEPYASELLQDPRTVESLAQVEKTFEPDVMLFDLPPALFYDDVIAFRPMFDGVLLVLGGGITTEKEIKEVERRLGDSTPLLGMILNKAENTELARYQY
ncbi:CpsD/CapB family tyrosine-protein kinase [Thalassococcus lentus]|uniref:CobQ/CobB/MinD/ParA nucleotide binding domain-containing protein n=1 Tax=Thalassococcus lentus TaxID=1210524 RepID=A0ABT4XNK0_9RHOB|nr:hypothetical protein [Thalassococcus lentus]MDA7423500.1 hypothetical protein [Thalassococcus lentus]